MAAAAEPSLTPEVRNDLIIENRAQLERIICRQVRAAPLRHRDEATGHLWLMSVLLTDGWKPSSGVSYLGYMTVRLRWALIDWQRRQDGWSRIRRDGVDVEEYDDNRSLLASTARSPQRHVEILEAIRLLEQLTPRELVALTAPDLRTAAATLDVSQARVSQLRTRAGQRLAGFGALELLAS